MNHPRGPLMANELRPPVDDNALPPARATGVVIAAASVLSVAFMMLHPTVHARGVANFVEAVVREAFRNVLVHGALIALMAALVCGFWGLASRLGLRSLCVRGGLVAYVFGALTMTAAA